MHVSHRLVLRLSVRTCSGRPAICKPGTRLQTGVLRARVRGLKKYSSGTQRAARQPVPRVFDRSSLPEMCRCAGAGRVVASFPSQAGPDDSRLIKAIEGLL
jgi:hypothetical protein